MKGVTKFKSLKDQIHPKATPMPSSLENAETEAKKVLAPSVIAKREREAAQKASMTGRFFFSVVFANEDELDAYLRERGIRLRDDEYIFGSEVDVRLRK